MFLFNAFHYDTGNAELHALNYYSTLPGVLKWLLRLSGKTYLIGGKTLVHKNKKSFVGVL